MTEILTTNEAVEEIADTAMSKSSSARRVIFLSHASPEDNTFATWLSSQLAIAGYVVWCDVTALNGGERFWNNIEQAINEATFLFLFVSALPGELFAKFQTSFYSDPVDAGFKALGVE